MRLTHGAAVLSGLQRRAMLPAARKWPLLTCLLRAQFAQVPELNVQNGVLKALSFLFEYIGEMGKDYIYAVSPLLEDALMDRDLVRPDLALPILGCSPGT